MSLKRIELEGFKSFPKRTVIDINDNFTCIVGPNGCGKSNVSDAVRWVLGEQSAKAIRGSSMKDVIFNGTEKLPEMGYAEVTLVFDNSDGRFKWPESEFSVGRKIFRSKGDNIYYINNKKVNRSEIVALLRDTGAGKEGFSIVGQGRISEIINAKPVDRRKIFDEAAGISQVKNEKKDYEKKLERNNLEMKDFETRLSVMQENLVIYERQAKAAQEYKRLSKEIMIEEMNYFVHVYENAESEKNKIRAHIKELEEYIANQENSLDKIRTDLGKIDGEVKGIEDTVMSELSRREELRVTNERANSIVRTHKMRIENENETLAKLKSDKSACDKSIEVNTENLAKANEELKLAKEQKAEADLSLIEANAQYEGVTAQISDLDKKIESYNFMRISGADKLGETMSQKGAAKGEADILRENLNDYEKGIEELKDSIRSKNQAVATTDEKIRERNSIFEQAKNEKQVSVRRTNELREKLAALNKQNEDCEKVLAVSEHSLEILERQLKEERGYNRVTTSVLERGKREPQFARFYRGAVGDLYTVEEKYRDAIITALGGAVNNIITDGTYEAGKVLEYVKTLHQGRLICYPLSEVRGETLAREYRYCLHENGVCGIASELISYDLEFDEIFKRLLGRIVIVENYQVGERIWKQYAHGFKIVTLDGEYFDTSGSISAGDNKSDTEKRYYAKKKEIEEIGLRKAKLNTLIRNLEKEAISCSESLEKNRDLGNKLESEIEVLRAEKNSILKTIEDLNKRLAEQETLKSIVKTRLESKLREISDAENEGGKASKARMSLDEMLESAKEERKLLADQQDSLSKTKEERLIEVNRLANAIETLNKEISRLTRDLEGNRDLSAILQEDIRKKTEIVESLIATMPKVELSEDQQRQVDEINARVENLQKRKEALTVEKASLERDRENITQHLMMASNTRASKLTSIDNVDNELRDWTQKILNTYEADYSVAVTYKIENFDYKDSSSRVGKLSASRKRLGDINHEAENMYNELKNDYDILNAEFNDLLSSKENLQKIIERIKKEMDAKFNDAFEAIKVNFQKTFSDLFGGGKAELSLIANEDEPDEEQGVEVSVQIPEKSKKSLSLLSGGEQSLTAIALLFAILKLKSSPFVILDEVESALDDSNCMRFARYLKQFSQYTRFLVISHKKFTMEKADVLYGVTMEIPGVSDIFSVSFVEAVNLSEK